MKKIIFWNLVCIILLIFPVIKNAQTFSVEIQDTVKSDSVGAEIIFDFHITNLTTSEVTLNFVRIKNEKPQEWTSSLCFDFCFRNDIDSIVTNSDYGSSPLAADETREFSVHVLPKTNEGEANIEIKIANTNNPNEFKIYALSAKTVVTSVEEENTFYTFKLNQNYPNPFNPTTIIKYTIPAEDANFAITTLKIYDVLGKEVATLVNQKQNPGSHEVNFSAEGLSSGVYLYRLEVNNLVKIKKMIVSK